MSGIENPAGARPIHLLRQADRVLVLAQQLTAWITHAHELDEEVALANVALDLIGQARALYSHVADLDGRGLSEDDYAYLRDDRQFLNPLLVEQPNGDFAQTMVRQFLHDAYSHELWSALLGSADEHLAAIAGKAVKETAYHVRHAVTWVVRLGDGTPESHRRTQTALDRLWRYTGELFELDAVDDELIDARVAPDPRSLYPRWLSTVESVVREATLDLPAEVPLASGGRAGLHGEEFGRLLGEMQTLQRIHPAVRW
jgi:ring-1,2-phenylacetyl-CoA epoxidase subunit PaaC